MTLDIIIVNYNVKHYLWQCLDSVRRASQGLDVETWVVDNASTDGSVPFLRESFPDVHFIENTENVGFARANNQAIQASSGDLVLLLNPDTFMEEDALTHCIDFFGQHLRAGAVGVHMVNRDGSFARAVCFPKVPCLRATTWGICPSLPTDRLKPSPVPS